MCGIFGIVSNKNVIDATLEGISNLEYRGYDSSGIGYVDNNKISVIKEVGEIQNLISSVKEKNISSTTAISHTRWATHGSPTQNNAHPFVSDNGEFCLVHNGIIENYKELKSITKSSYTSDTDSEVVLKLVEEYYNGDMLHTLRKVCDMLKGSYAIALLTKYEPDKIYVVKNISPCVLGMGQNETKVSSDINGIGEVEYVHILENNNISILSPNKVEIFDENLELIELEKIKVDQQKSFSKGSFDHFMRKEIYEIPATIKNTCMYYSDINDMMDHLHFDIIQNTKNILIIGCGTAYHAGLIGKKLLEENTNLNIKCEIASEFIYSNINIHENTLAIIVSQSGETADSLKALQIAKAKGFTTLAITNVKNSSITFVADYCLYTYAGTEVAVASTKAYIGQLTIFYLLSSYFSQDLTRYKMTHKHLTELSLTINLKDIEDIASQIADKIYDEHDIYMIGRNFDYITAMEASLKLKEISYIHSEAYPSGELKHGTISLIEKGTFVFVFMTEKQLIEKSISNALEIIARGANVITISNHDIDLTSACQNTKLNIPNDSLMPIVSIILMQFIAYHTSIKKGLNPDKPRALAKSVTVE